MSQSADRNLLFGLLAVQNDFISPRGLVAAVSDWRSNKERPLEPALQVQVVVGRFQGKELRGALRRPWPRIG